MSANKADSGPPETFSPCYCTGIFGPETKPGHRSTTPDGFVPVRTDYLTVTGPVPSSADFDVPASLIAIVAAAVGDAFGEATVRNRGLLGYENSIRWEHGGAVAAWGGQRETAMISLPGEACDLVTDWPRLVEVLRDCFEGRITRWDGAADDAEGDHSVDKAADDWKEGRWKGRGRPPKASNAGNWMIPDGRGRTLYVGSRAAGKIARVYEKGKQLGDPNSPWVRWEVEVHRVSREIPWAVCTNPRPYIARSYPAMAWVEKPGNVGRIPTHRPSGPISLDHLVKHATLAYGRLLELLVGRGFEPATVVGMLSRPGTPKRLAHDELVRLRDIKAWTPSELPGWYLSFRRQENERRETVRVGDQRQLELDTSPRDRGILVDT